MVNFIVIGTGYYNILEVSAMATYTLTKKRKYKGTAKADIFTIPKSVKAKIKKIQITALGGNDLIYVKGGSGHIINTGAGNDTVYLQKGNGHKVTLGTAKKQNTVNVTAGTSHTITGSKNKDVLKISGGMVKTANLGNGNDVITVSNKGSLQTLNAGAGTNSLTVSGNGVVNKATFGGDNDTVKVTGGAIKNLDVGKGTNTLTISGGTVVFTKGTLNTVSFMSKDGKAGMGSLTVAGGSVSKISGKGTVTVAGGSVSEIVSTGKVTVSGGSIGTLNRGSGTTNLTVSGGTIEKAILGAGNDIIIIKGGTVKDLNVGEGENKLTVSDGSVNVTGGNLSSINCTGNGVLVVDGGNVGKINGTDSANNIIGVYGQKLVNINTGNGENRVYVNGRDNDTSNISKGIITTGSGKDSIFVYGFGYYGGGMYRINSGGGEDKIDIASCSCITYSGDGKDTITVGPSDYSNYVDAGLGDDEITQNMYLGNNLIDGADGNDTIIIKKACDTDGKKDLIVGGQGQDTYIVKAINDLFIIDNNDGTNDTLKLNIDVEGFESTINSTDLYDNVKYDPGNDILKFKNFYIAGFTKLGDVYLDGQFFKTANQVIEDYNLTTYGKFYQGFGGVLTEINTIRDNWKQIVDYNYAAVKGFPNNDLAIFAGYTNA